MTRFCYTTLFDSAYAPQGLAMMESLHARARDEAIDVFGAVLALDDAAERAAKDFVPQEIVCRLDSMKGCGPVPARGAPSYREFCWKLASAFTLAAAQIPQLARVGEPLTYLDADMFWFRGPGGLLEAMAGRSVGVVPHRFLAQDEARLGPNGRYNVSAVSFRLDEIGRAALDRWAGQCAEWCQSGSGDRAKFQYCGDQGYLDEWPRLYGEALAEFPPEIGAGPWNLRRHKVEAGPIVDGKPLVAYHFHEWRAPGRRTGYMLRREDIEHVYKAYEAAVARWRQRIDAGAAC